MLLQADEELAQYILKAGVLPYFALSWYITWFAHEVQSLPQIARLFDLFMASHPLMPLYVGAAAMKVRPCQSMRLRCAAAPGPVLSCHASPCCHKESVGNLVISNILPCHLWGVHCCPCMSCWQQTGSVTV